VVVPGHHKNGVLSAGRPASLAVPGIDHGCALSVFRPANHRKMAIPPFSSSRKQDGELDMDEISAETDAKNKKDVQKKVANLDGLDKR
jgi:hypothetical protein